MDNYDELIEKIKFTSDEEEIHHRAKMSDFTKALENLLNKYSIDNDCNTNDFILAEYLILCIDNYKRTKEKNDRMREEK